MIAVTFFALAMAILPGLAGYGAIRLLSRLREAQSGYDDERDRRARDARYARLFRRSLPKKKVAQP